MLLIFSPSQTVFLSQHPLQLSIYPPLKLVSLQLISWWNLGRTEVQVVNCLTPFPSLPSVF